MERTVATRWRPTSTGMTGKGVRWKHGYIVVFCLVRVRDDFILYMHSFLIWYDLLLLIFIIGTISSTLKKQKALNYSVYIFIFSSMNLHPSWKYYMLLQASAISSSKVASETTPAWRLPGQTRPGSVTSETALNPPTFAAGTSAMSRHDAICCRPGFSCFWRD